MRLKYIIIAIIASGAILLGTYNWISYFKDQAGLPGHEVKALRPPSDLEISRVEQVSTAGVQKGEPARAPKPEKSSQTLAQFPDSVERNPFLTLEEIEAISRGETLGATLPPVSGPVENLELPELRLTGLVKDIGSGNYRAIINGRAYTQGEKVGDEEIVEITGNSVILEYGGKRRTLTLGSGKEARAGAATIKMKKNP